MIFKQQAMMALGALLLCGTNPVGARASEDHGGSKISTAGRLRGVPAAAVDRHRTLYNQDTRTGESCSQHSDCPSNNCAYWVPLSWESKSIGEHLDRGRMCCPDRKIAYVEVEVGVQLEYCHVDWPLPPKPLSDGYPQETGGEIAGAVKDHCRNDADCYGGNACAHWSVADQGKRCCPSDATYSYLFDDKFWGHLFCRDMPLNTPCYDPNPSCRSGYCYKSFWDIIKGRAGRCSSP